jgi:hypothetical protein
MAVSPAPSFCEKSLDRIIYERTRAVWRRLPLVGCGVDNAPGALNVGRRPWDTVAEFFEDESYRMPLDLLIS